MKAISRILWGLALVAVGVVLVLNATGVADINLFFKGWWALFIIVPSVIGLFGSEGRRASLIGLVGGVSLLLAAQEVISFDAVWKIIVAAILVVMGLSFIFGFDKYKKVREIRKDFKNKGNEDDGYTVAFSGQKIKFDGEELEDFEAKAVFGGLELDLRKAVFKKEATINVSAVCGGVNILVPSDVVVKTASTSFCGGVSNKTKATEKKSSKVLNVNVSAVFGGVEIK